MIFAEREARGSQYVGELSDVYRRVVSIETYCMRGTISSDFPRRSGTARIILPSCVRNMGMNYARNFFDIKSGPVRHRDKNIFSGTRKD